MQCREYRQVILGAGLGAGVGSIVTYYNRTRDKRTIRAVCRAMDEYGLKLCVRGAIPNGQYGEIRESYYQRPSERFVSDERILGDYRWTQGIIKEHIQRNRGPDPAILAGLTIICMEFLGLQPIDAFQAQRVQRVPARNLSLEASAPQRMTATAQASGA